MTACLWFKRFFGLVASYCVSGMLTWATEYFIDNSEWNSLFNPVECLPASSVYVKQSYLQRKIFNLNAVDATCIPCRSSRTNPTKIKAGCAGCCDLSSYQPLTEWTYWQGRLSCPAGSLFAQGGVSAAAVTVTSTPILSPVWLTPLYCIIIQLVFIPS
jgi:hypothetical protein